MAIRFVDRPAVIGRASSTLAGASSLLQGTHVLPAARTGVIGTQLAPAVAAMQGGFTASANRQGVVGTTLAGASALLTGTGNGNLIQLVSATASRRALEFHMPLADSNPLSHVYDPHRMAPAGRVWAVPICVKGGVFPYSHRVTGPVGMEVVYSFGFVDGVPTFYCYLQWANPTIGAHAYTVTSTDQVGSVVTRSSVLHVYDAADTSRFLHFDSVVGNNANPGTPELPKRDMGGWYLGNRDDATHANKQCYYQGVFNIGGVAGVVYDGTAPNYWRAQWRNTKPKVHKGYGTGATWRGNNCYIDLNAQAGPWLQDLTLENPLVVEGGSTRKQHLYGVFPGGGTFRLTFRGEAGAVGQGSNSSCIMDPNSSQTYSYWCHVANVMDGVSDQSGFKNYNACDGYLEGWEVRNCSNLIVVHHKGGDIRRVITRGFKCIENNTSIVFQEDQWINTPIARHDLEMSWCNVITDTYGRHLNGGANTNFENTDNFRNNVRCAQNRTGASQGVWTSTDEITQHTGNFPNGMQNLGTGSVAFNNVLAAQSGLFDPVTNLLTGAARAAVDGLGQPLHYGRKGCEMRRAA